MTDVVHYYASV